MHGLLNVNKPSGLTSRDVVNHVQRLVRPAKVGHAGTLDPLASGVLLLCIGPATRLIEFLHQMPKQYRATFLFGQQSDTEDIEGSIICLDNPRRPPQDDVEDSLPRFIGTIQQLPPKFSALNIGGRRAYQLARRGVEFELSPRPVTIHHIQLIKYDYPELVLDVCCGSGTYIRSLGRDIAESLGTAAVMSALQRTLIGEFGVADACAPADLNSDSLSHWLLPLLAAVPMLRRTSLSEPDLKRIRSGQSIEIEKVAEGEEDQVAAIDPTGKLCAILVRRQDGWGPSRNLM